jgi:protein-S-isoprenylcysteine O-methyltransferase Ste14
MFIGVFVGMSLVSSVFLAKNPDVLRRRMRGPTAETRPVQKAAATGIYVLFTALLVVSALDRWFGWSHVPAAVSWCGAALVAIGLGVTLLVVVQNNYAAASVAVEDGQKVVSTGLYGIVRHPMYVGALVMLVGIPLALGSFWALAALLPLPVGLAARILDEEKALADELDGYREYMHDVHYRLVPHVW